MKKGTKASIYLVCMVIFCVWMYTANDIIATTADQIPARKADFNDYSTKRNAQVYYAFDDFTSVGTMREIISISGWATVESKYDNQNAQTSLILKNGSDTYALICQDPEEESGFEWDIMREDVLAALPHLNIQTAHVGFRSDFSLLNVKNGVYDVYIYRQENEFDSGIIRTSKQLVKNSTDIILRDRQITESLFTTLSGRNEGRARLESWKEDGEGKGSYTFNGWAYSYQEKNSGNKAISVVLKDTNSDICYVYEQEATSRPDVFNAFASSGQIVGNNHGFNAKFSIEPIPDGQYDLYIYIVENDECKCLVDMKMRFVKDGLSLHCEELLQQ